MFQITVSWIILTNHCLKAHLHLRQAKRSFLLFRKLLELVEAPVEADHLGGVFGQLRAVLDDDAELLGPARPTVAQVCAAHVHVLAEIQALTNDKMKPTQGCDGLILRKVFCSTGLPLDGFDCH